MVMGLVVCDTGFQFSEKKKSLPASAWDTFRNIFIEKSDTFRNIFIEKTKQLFSGRDFINK